MSTYVKLALPTLSGTALVALRIAAGVRPGDVICLDGPLAAGKTAFVSAFAQAMNSSDSASSPTYTLAHIYQSPRMPIVHVDAYRLSGHAEFLDLGLEEEMEDGVTLIEWAGKLEGALKASLSLELSLADDGSELRYMTLKSDQAHWINVFPALAEGLTS